jgi:hypothetical protein
MNVVDYIKNIYILSSKHHCKYPIGLNPGFQTLDNKVKKFLTV